MGRPRKENPLTARIQIRMTPETRRRIEEAAGRDGEAAGEWVREAALARLRGKGR
jgi:uncharacterized protein (DUF1778 family)